MNYHPRNFRSNFRSNAKSHTFNDGKKDHVIIICDRQDGDTWIAVSTVARVLGVHPTHMVRLIEEKTLSLEGGREQVFLSREGVMHYALRCRHDVAKTVYAWFKDESNFKAQATVVPDVGLVSDPDAMRRPVTATNSTQRDGIRRVISGAIVQTFSTQTGKMISQEFVQSGTPHYLAQNGDIMPLDAPVTLSGLGMLVMGSADRSH